MEESDKPKAVRKSRKKVPAEEEVPEEPLEPLEPEEAPEEVPAKPRKKALDTPVPRVRKAPIVSAPEPPPPLDASFFGELLRTQWRMEKDKRVERLTNMRFT